MLLLGCLNFLKAFASICLILSRVTLNFLPTSNRLQVYWGSYADTSLIVDRVDLDVTNDMVINQNKTGITIDGKVAGGGDTTWSTTYVATGSSPTSTYKLFTYSRNTSIHFGLFRSAVIRNYNPENNNGDPLYTIVPEVSEGFTGRLKITDHTLNTTRYVDIPDGFIYHVEGNPTS